MASERMHVECLECGAKFKTASLTPECPKCGSTDIDLAEVYPAFIRVPALKTAESFAQ